MLCAFLTFLLTSLCAVISFSEATSPFATHAESLGGRKILSGVKRAGNKTRNDTKEGKNLVLKEDESVVGTEAAVLIIVVVVVLSVIGMVVYFVRKFDQLNRSLPSYRYSSLKTEINGVYGPDDKTESQVLVSVSTEEEDDYDDEDSTSPPTLLVQSQTVMPVAADKSPVSVGGSLDSDDELLQ